MFSPPKGGNVSRATWTGVKIIGEMCRGQSWSTMGGKNSVDTKKVTSSMTTRVRD